MSSIVWFWKKVWKENSFPGKVEPILIIWQILGGPETQMVSNGWWQEKELNAPIDWKNL